MVRESLSINNMAKRLIRLPDVMSITGLKRSTIYLKMKDGDFPKSIPIGERSVAWVEGEVNKWIEKNISKRG
ncbi:AlpA family transcriptional regulator [uncultured Serratia sp.]|uniref:helix-turn-helix transcriptional regulator n=1 Tax=uncultured Serratia sp. TaxID=239175 RepID=UPI00258ACF15|nr:AlpA family transcriptional regulator [uncultured Serratia sp.]